jgi:hypothetical protein
MNDPNELKEMIKEAVYEVIEPFIAQMARDHDETRQWMRSARNSGCVPWKDGWPP